MALERPVILALASELKGLPYLAECHRQGCHVVVVMDDKLTGEPWPWEVIGEHFTMPNVRVQPDVTHAVSYLARDRSIVGVVGLDDYDVETAAALREHLRLPGMGDSQARFFRDKLAMRVRARDEGLSVPAFTGIFNYDDLRRFMAGTPPPWVFKPRTLAGSEGIRKLYESETLWRLLDTLGDQRSYYLLEQFLPGEVYHVDGLCWQGEVVFALASRYGAPPMSTLQGRNIFSTQVLPRDAAETRELLELNRQVIQALGRGSGPTHTEFIRAEDGRFYFLETAARVGGGNIEKLVEAATGLALWREAARIDLATLRGESYRLPEAREGYAGLIVCFSKHPFADTGHYTEPEIVFRPQAAEFATLVVGSQSFERVEELLVLYAERFRRDFM